jgi:hypothetical protein
MVPVTGTIFFSVTHKCIETNSKYDTANTYQYCNETHVSDKLWQGTYGTCFMTAYIMHPNQVIKGNKYAEGVQGLSADRDIWA